MNTLLASKRNGDRIVASPLARRLAKEKTIDLATIKGSGPHGRIIKADILNQKTSSSLPTTVRMEAANIPLTPDFTLEKISTVRRIIATRLSESKQTIPHFYLTADCQIDRLLETRKEFNMLLEEGQKVSINDILVKICGLALHDVPDANVAWSDDGMKKFHRADISVAVAIKDGLITPIVKDAGKRTVASLSSELKILIDKARAGKLVPEEYQGGTFSISNMGMYGIKNFQAIINPPQAGILAIGSAEKRPAFDDDGRITAKTFLQLTLSMDHRAIDGAAGAAFLNRIKHYTENPLPVFIGTL